MSSHPKHLTPAELLRQAWLAGVARVHGKRLTAEALDASARPWDAILAIGKAAQAMALAALEQNPAAPALVISKHPPADHPHPNAEYLTGGHPVPTEASLAAGRRALDFLHDLPTDSKLLVLISGGASALIEVPRPGIDLERLQAANRALLAGGWAIGQMNLLRGRLSDAKGGRLLRAYPGETLQVLAISDVPGDQLTDIGSGIGCPEVIADRPLPEDLETLLNTLTPEALPPRPAKPAPPGWQAKIIGSNTLARTAVAEYAAARSLPVIHNQEDLQGDAQTAAKAFARLMRDGPPGLYISGGETTVQLPENPGLGGRNQTFALTAALQFQGTNNLHLLSAGTDAEDGNNNAAGALINGQIAQPPEPARQALSAADAGSYLDTRDALFHCEPTETNVMDLVVALKVP